MKIYLLLLFILLFQACAIGQVSQSEWGDSKNKNCKFFTNGWPAFDYFTWSGNCKNGYCSGKGKLVAYKNNKMYFTYIGPCVEGKANGNGRVYRFDGSILYDGEFKDSYRHGKGTFYDGETKYVGDFSNGKPHGFGIQYENNEIVYKGFWANGSTVREKPSRNDITLVEAAAVVGLLIAGVQALSNDKESSSSSDNVYSSTSSSDKSKTDLYLLSIGVSDYQDNSCAPDLSYAHVDAIDIAERLKKGDGNSNLFSNVYTKVLTNGNATKANIIDAINAIRSKANENDVIIISVSSHGDINSNNGTFYLTPNDFNCNNEFSSSVNLDLIVKGIDCENCATIIWLDACHAGGAGTDFYKKLDDYARNKQGQNINLLVSSDDSETSLESSRWGHGAFSKAILDGLNGSADQNSNGIISLRELTEYVTRVVPNMTNYDQHPFNPVKQFSNTRLSTY